MNKPTAPPSVQLTQCPQCDAPAEVVRRTVLQSTHGPIEHVAVRCVSRHHFLLPTAAIEQVGPRVARPNAAPVTPR